MINSVIACFGELDLQVHQIPSLLPSENCHAELSGHSSVHPGMPDDKSVPPKLLGQDFIPIKHKTQRGSVGTEGSQRFALYTGLLDLARFGVDRKSVV